MRNTTKFLLALLVLFYLGRLDDVSRWFFDLADSFAYFATSMTQANIGFLITSAATGGLLAIASVLYKRHSERLPWAQRVTCPCENCRRRRVTPLARIAIVEPNPLLSDDELARSIEKLSTPPEETPERCPTPTPRALTDGTWDRWDAAEHTSGIKVHRNGAPALDRPFTLETDCRSGHIGRHHVGERWTDITGTRRVMRTCAYLCHSTWSETV